MGQGRHGEEHQGEHAGNWCTGPGGPEEYRRTLEAAGFAIAEWGSYKEDEGERTEEVEGEIKDKQGSGVVVGGAAVIEHEGKEA